ncbi:Diacetylchitobiose uptake system permease protein NgcF [Baekduia alba]|nr:Diacetylchitobiose uptake system permease protein NgcF [Baekduia alba]
MRWPVALSILPGLLLFLAFYVVPLGMLVVTSFADWSGLGFHYLGVRNFTDMAHDATFWKAAKNTMLYVAAGVFVEVPLGVLAGVILAQHVRGWRVFRTVLFIPFVISGAAYALVFALFYDPTHGLLNSALGLVGLNHHQDWLFSTSTALPAVAGTFVFILGLVIVLVMAEVASIPRELYEAAEIDGASVVQRQLRITLPLLRNVIGTVVLVTVLGYLALFDVVFILTKGGPDDSTLTLALYAYKAYVNNAWGYASAVGIVIVVVGLVLILGIRRLFRLGERTL